MKETRALMGMPITVEIVDKSTEKANIDGVFSYFENIEERFSFFKADSEISRINDGRIKESQWSSDMRTIFSLAEKTKRETNGYFDISIPEGKYNPSGIVKGWAIYNASKMLLSKGFHNFYVDAGGDIQAHGKNDHDQYWSVGIKHPFDQNQIVKVIYLKDRGIATSGTYIRGQHIYDPYERSKYITEIVSMSVIGQDVFEADRFATAAFAMGSSGIDFIENLEGFEGYVINKDGIATKTSGFEKFCDYKKI